MLLPLYNLKGIAVRNTGTESEMFLIKAVRAFWLLYRVFPIKLRAVMHLGSCWCTRCIIRVGDGIFCLLLCEATFQGKSVVCLFLVSAAIISPALKAQWSVKGSVKRLPSAGGGSVCHLFWSFVTTFYNGEKWFQRREKWTGKGRTQLMRGFREGVNDAWGLRRHLFKQLSALNYTWSTASFNTPTSLICWKASNLILQRKKQETFFFLHLMIEWPSVLI